MEEVGAADIQIAVGVAVMGIAAVYAETSAPLDEGKPETVVTTRGTLSDGFEFPVDSNTLLAEVKVIVPLG